MRRQRTAWAALAGLVIAVTPLVSVRGVSTGRSTFIVQLALSPLAGYDGGLGAFSATSPKATGRPLDVGTPEARRYQAFLDAASDRALGLARAGTAPVVYRYRAAFPGFAARLTAPEVARLRVTPGVRAVTRDGVSHPLAVNPPKDPPGPLGRDGAAFLGLPDGLWKELGGPDHAGEGVIVGVLDTGIYPEHPSFAATPMGDQGRRYEGPAYQPPKLWRGVCQSGDEFPVSSCNNKLIGARYFVEGFGVDQISEKEFLSPRDAGGHGSHTAATTAGNYGVDPQIAGNDLGIPLISGIAPRAHIAAYKVCWSGRTTPGRPPVADSCTTSDIVAAIDAAVSDGVDVINESLGADSPSVLGPVEQAFLYASDAGVFVANAAGNEGPKPRTIGSPAAVPWVTAVGASTLARTFESSLVVRPDDPAAGKPRSTKGKSLSGGLAPTPLLDAATVAAVGAEVADAERCFPGSLNPKAVAGKVVLCKRGENPRTEKGKVVADAGGVGMVLYNAKADETLVADPHYLPAVHVSLADGEAIRALLASGSGVKAEIGGGKAVEAPGDVMAEFSSRGPQQAVPDIPKPDLTAPGVDVLAAFTPTPADQTRSGETFAPLSGTSMSSPHVAGAAALLTQQDPTRSPATIKSALMTTANPKLQKVEKDDKKIAADTFDMGSGRIDPNRAAHPGLVLEVTTPDYLRYLEGVDPKFVDGDIPPLAAADLNLPAVSFGAFSGVGATARTFTSVERQASSWKATIEGLPGVEWTVKPTTFDISPGQSQTVELTFKRTDAPLDAYTFGAVVLTNGADRRTVRLPLSIRPVKIAAPPTLEVVTDQASGATPISARAGYEGQLSALGWGLARPQPAPGQTVGPGRDAKPFEASPGVDVFDVKVPPGSKVLAALVSNADAGAKDTDLDLFLFFDEKGDGFDEEDRIDESADGNADEAIAVALPKPGNYRFGVVGFKTRDPVTSYDFTTWLATDHAPDDPNAPPGAPGVAVTGDPKTVTLGAEAVLSLEWTGLPADGLYFGLATFHDSAPPDPATPNVYTIVRIVKAPPGTSPPPWPRQGWSDGGPSARATAEGGRRHH